jgi:endoglucanase
MPLPILRRFAAVSPNGPWDEIATNTALLISVNNPKGYAVDWLSYESKPDGNAGFIVDPEKGERGSYDAIRVYLWAGMTSKKDPLATPIMKSLHGMTEAALKNGMPPEVINVQQGTFSGVSPIGFSAALLPFFKTSGQVDVLSKQLNRVNKAIVENASQQQTESARMPYYDYVLCLFGTGWIEKRYQFMPNGKLNN